MSRDPKIDGQLQRALDPRLDPKNVDIRGDDEAVWVEGILHDPNMPQPFLISNVALLGQRVAAVMPSARPAER
jgi:hypothetical protein